MAKKKDAAEAVIEKAPLRPVDETSKEELLFLLSELHRLNIRSISDLENLVARA